MKRVGAHVQSTVGYLHVGLALPSLQAAHQGFASCFSVEIVIFILYLNGVIWINCHLCWELLNLLSEKPVLSCLVSQTRSYFCTAFNVQFGYSS